ncbi:hypothetical protein DL96DRAFT_1620408 [Flagelloscypha sp. PMI_526]|nr:hypothetical protein DL96DRAFT_1620408 [Flagelloscypha sp. PMI_526]
MLTLRAAFSPQCRLLFLSACIWFFRLRRRASDVDASILILKQANSATASSSLLRFSLGDTMILFIRPITHGIMYLHLGLVIRAWESVNVRRIPASALRVCLTNDLSCGDGLDQNLSTPQIT